MDARRRSRPVLLLASVAFAAAVGLIPLGLEAPARAGGRPAGPAGTIHDLDLLSPLQGWLHAGTDLYWTGDGGATWARITPDLPAGTSVAAVSFADALRGWVLLAGPGAGGWPAYALARTLDRGASWHTAPLALFEPGDPAALAGAATLSMADPAGGWLAIKQATSASFSRGALFHTADGGDTWTRRSLPIGEPAAFASPQRGWAAGGASGQELLHTLDGGRTWQPLALSCGPLPAEQWRLPMAPSFGPDGRGLLPVALAGDEQGQVEFYATADAGRTWSLAVTVPYTGTLAPGAHLAWSRAGEAGWLVLLPGQAQVMRLAPDAAAVSAVGSDPRLAGAVELDMASAQAGWALARSGECSSAPGSAERRCRLSERLLRTQDGGRTWAELVLPGGVGGAPSAALDGRTAVYLGHAFDKCEVASLTQLQAWFEDSPYAAVNLYIGGIMRGCPNSALTADFIQKAARQGWTFIPTWVGPQAACSGYSQRMSFDPATAFQQGRAEADAAVEAATALGLVEPDGTGGIVYYDLEAYNTANAACRAAANAFISGWSGRLRELGNLAGAYGATCASAVRDWANQGHPPDAVWLAWWTYDAYDPDASVWNLICLPNDLWVQNQRIRQYAGGHPETWGGVTLNIDCSTSVGIVARRPTLPYAFGAYLPVLSRH